MHTYRLIIKHRSFFNLLSLMIDPFGAGTINTLLVNPILGSSRDKGLYVLGRNAVVNFTSCR